MEEVYDPSKCVIFQEIPGVNVKLFCYIVVAIIFYIICVMILSSNINHIRGYQQRYEFLSEKSILVGGILSSLVLGFICYILSEICQIEMVVFFVFLLINIILICWYFNLVYRCEKYTHLSAGNGSGLEQKFGHNLHTGNGTSFLVIIIVLIFLIMVIGLWKNCWISLLLLIPIVWYSIILYYWISK